ncbi:MAG: hypothetical protein WCP66_08290 [Methylococcales bacterium]
MIDREYYPLAMAAKILECSEDDLIHFAATQKIQIHVLTDGNTYSRIYDGYEQLSSTVLVHYEYFMAIESKINTAPSLSLVIQDIDKKNHINTVNEPFFKLSSENLYQSIDVYMGLFDFELDGVVNLTNFVILHSELMKLKKPVEQNAINDAKGSYTCGVKDKTISESERTSMLKLIIGMAIDSYSYDPYKPKNSASGENSNGISSKLSTHGIKIHADTVRKYLTEAEKLI